MKMIYRILFLCTLTAALGMILPAVQAQSREDTPVVVKRVIPSKILYGFNEQATVTVWLKNNSDKKQVGTLILRESWDINESREIGRSDISIAPGEEKRDISFSWNVGDVMYGRAARAEFMQAGEVVTSGEEFFSVADDWLRVNIIVAHSSTPELGPFDLYGNHAMLYSFAPCDFSELSPDEEKWYSGQAGYHIVKSEVISAIAGNHKKGIRTSAYASWSFSGSTGREFTRQHPEWVLRNKNGSYHRRFTQISPLDASRPITDKASAIPGGVVDFYDTGAVKFGAEEIVRGIRMFGYDGVFFDGFYTLFPAYSWDGEYTPHGKNPNELSARNVRLCRQIIRESFPHCALWYNVSPDWPKGPFEQTWSNSGGLESFAELSSDANSGTLFEFMGATLKDPGDWSIWRNLYEHYANRRDERIGGGWAPQARGAVVNSGYMFNIDFKRNMTEKEYTATRDVWTVANHVGSFFLAQQLHPCFNSSSSWRPITQFMTRYSTLLWDQEVKKVVNSTEIVKVASSRPVWWQESVYRREGKGYVDYLVHLINTAEKERVDIRATQDPPAAEDVIVQLTPAEKIGSVEAYAMRPYYYEGPHVPAQFKLTPDVRGSSVRIEVPPFRYYMLVAVRFYR